MIRDSIEECVPHKDPLERPDYTEAEVQAIRACYHGTADERQQRIALDYLIRAAGTHDLSYRPGDTHATAFAEGKKWVGQTLIWMIKAAESRTDPDKTATRNMDHGRDSRKS